MCCSPLRSPLLQPSHVCPLWRPPASCRRWRALDGALAQIWHTTWRFGHAARLHGADLHDLSAFPLRTCTICSSSFSSCNHCCTSPLPVLCPALFRHRPTIAPAAFSRICAANWGEKAHQKVRLNVSLKI